MFPTSAPKIGSIHCRNRLRFADLESAIASSPDTLGLFTSQSKQTIYWTYRPTPAKLFFVSTVLHPEAASPAPATKWRFRVATEADLPALRALVEASVRALSQGYSPAEIEGSVGTVLGLDTQLIRDRTYFLVETPGEDGVSVLAASGGWSNRKTLCGGDSTPGRETGLLDPAVDAAKIRAIYVHPAFARQGLGSAVLAYVEAEAFAAGFRRFEMGSTLTGVPLYSRKGYTETERFGIPLQNGQSLTVVRMVKSLPE